MESGSKRTQRDYTLAFKLAVVEQVEKGELTYKQAQARYGIQGRSTVLVWLRKHGRQGWGRSASCAAMPPDKTPQALTPEQQIKALVEHPHHRAGGREQQQGNRRTQAQGTYTVRGQARSRCSAGFIRLGAHDRHPPEARYSTKAPRVASLSHVARPAAVVDVSWSGGWMYATVLLTG